MNWVNAYILWLLFALIPLCFFGKTKVEQRTKLLIQLGYSGINWFFIEVMALLILISSLIFALAQPRFGYKTIEIEKENRDILILFDLSRSMWAHDMSPSRIKQAQREIQDLTTILKGERIGLIVFAKHPYPRMPLTTDYGMIKTLLPELSPEHIESQGSDIPKALDMAYDIFAYDQQPGGQSILLITDGEIEDNQNLIKSLNKLQKKNIPVFVIGMGTEEGSHIPLPNGGYVKNDADEKVVSKRMTDNLQKIAEETNGAYISSSPSIKDIELLYRDGILKVTSNKRTKHEEILYNEYFYYFVILAVFAWIISLLPIQISNTKEQQRTTKKANWGFLVGFLLFSYSSNIRADDDQNTKNTWSDIPQDLETAEQLAYKLFSSMDHTTARQIYESIFLQNEEEIGQRALFNAALAAHKEGQLHKSLSYLQKITTGPYEELARKTESQIEEEIKIRLENEKNEDPPDNNDNQNNENNTPDSPESKKKNDKGDEKGENNQGTDKENESEKNDSENKDQKEQNQSEKQENPKDPDSNSSPNDSQNKNQNHPNEDTRNSESNSQPQNLDDIEQKNTPSSQNGNSQQTKQPLVAGKEEQMLEDLEEKRPTTTVGGYSSNGGMTW
jgi:Ca-activated chloride channel homolog